MKLYNNNLTYTRNSVCIYSYNSRGFTQDKQDVCKLLMAETQVIHIQFVTDYYIVYNSSL